MNIELNELNGTGGDFQAINVTNLAPGGDSAFKCATVTNAGTLPFKWTMKGEKTSDDEFDLSDVLWARTYKWIDTDAAPEDCGSNENWELIGGVFGTLPVSAVLGVEAKRGELATDTEEHYKFEYFLPADVSDPNYMGAQTVLDLMVKAYQTNDPAYDAL